MTRSLHVVQTTVPGEPVATRLAEVLVGEGLAACVQMEAPIRSWYRWEGAIEDSREIPLTLKVRGDRLEACLARLTELHPYDTPELIAQTVDHVAPGYLDWAFEEPGE
jgi:periplasmic divalent cation tolerance protein